MQQNEKMNIFDYLEMFTLSTAKEVLPAGEHMSEDLPEEDIMSYLHRENKILSLAKESMKKLDDTLHLSELEEKIFSISYDEDDGLNAVLQKMAKIMRKYIKDIDLKPDKIAVIKEIVKIPIDIEVVDYKAVAKDIYRKIAGKTLQKLLKVTIHESGCQDMIVYGTVQTPHGTKYRNALFYNISYAVADLGFLFSYMILLARVNETILTQPDLAECRCKEAGALKTGYCPLHKGLTDLGITEEEFRKRPAFRMETHDEILEDILSSHYPGAKFLYGLQDTGNAVYIDKVYTEWLIYYCFPYEYGIKQPTTYHFLLSRNDRSCDDMYWALPTGKLHSPYAAFLTEVWKITSGVQNNLVRQFSYYKESGTEYAKSYQTKANIPQKIVSAMRKSILNEYFGYVEYDESVDLGKILEIEKEFKAFKDTYFPNVDTRNNSIRFRRLGNHKASGLYYPGMHCLCVDINCPSSMIHEFGHLIDYAYGNLSVKSRFYPVIAMYKDGLMHSMDRDESLKKAMQGRSKYNFSYYTMPTEIFARCYELYCTRILGISNSLVDASGFSYLNEPLLLEKIGGYFDELFKKGGNAA